MATIQKNDTPAMFDEIAHRYDLLNHLLSLNIDRLWRRDLVRAAGVDPSGRVLDACTGTADVAIGFARNSGPRDIIGVDRSGDMLRVGRRKLDARRLTGRVELLECDVLDMPFEPATFDAVTIAFGLRNLPDYKRGVAEMVRVLKPGGRFLVLEFCPPTRGLALAGYKFYLSRVVPIVGGIVSGSRQAYRYLASSIDEFLTRGQIIDLMNDAGLDGIEARKLTGGIAYLYRGVK